MQSHLFIIFIPVSCVIRISYNMKREKMLGTKMIFVLLLVKSAIDAKPLDILPKKNTSIIHEKIVSGRVKNKFTRYFYLT